MSKDMKKPNLMMYGFAVDIGEDGQTTVQPLTMDAVMKMSNERWMALQGMPPSGLEEKPFTIKDTIEELQRKAMTEKAVGPEQVCICKNCKYFIVIWEPTSSYSCYHPKWFDYREPMMRRPWTGLSTVAHITPHWCPEMKEDDD